VISGEGRPTIRDLLGGQGAGVGQSVDFGRLALGDRDSTAGPFIAAAVDDPVAIIAQPAPRYPAALALAGIAGRVELSYVVDTTGAVEPRSLRTRTSSHPAFEAAARASVMESRFKPARLQGQPVRQLVNQTITFRPGT
jgi:TonB family protein